MTAKKKKFDDFYRTVFLREHRHQANVAMHVVGVAAGFAAIAIALLSGTLWIALLFPVAHAVPGLLGHRMFERDHAAGDLRVTRKDYPLVWFIAGNHVMAWELMAKGFYWRSLE